MNRKINTKELFTGKAAVYANYRPSYPRALKEWLLERADLEFVADVGAGTGIFTAFLQESCRKIIGIEPNEDMRKAFQQKFPTLECLAASAENIPLPDNSLSLITAAQAFHWFDAEKFRRECIRLLKDNGKLLIVWNNAVPTGFSLEVKAVCQKYCPAFKSGHAGAKTPEEGDCFLREEYFQTLEFFKTPNNMFRTEEEFLGDQLSRSYALKDDDPLYGEYLQSLRDVFQKFSKDALVSDEYETTAYFGTV